MNPLPRELRTAVKPDLNLIYTERPFSLPSGNDFGWFCREHALHTYLLGCLLDLEPAIICGDISFRAVDRPSSTLPTDADHAWCRLAGIAPVDLSAEFRHYPGFPKIPMVQGTDQSGPYSVVYLPAERAEESYSILEEKDPVVVYVEREVITPDPLDLIEDPYSFLLPPPPNERRFTQIHGEDVFDRITMHCYKLINGAAKSVALYCDAKIGLQRVKKWNDRSAAMAFTGLNSFSADAALGVGEANLAAGFFVDKFGCFVV